MVTRCSSSPHLFPHCDHQEPTGIEEITATLNGRVDPEGGSNVTSCEFEYGETTSYGHTATCSPVTPYSSVTGVSAAISGLEPGHTYHYRLVAENADGKTGQSNDATFTTRGAPSIGGELSIARTASATVKAQINPFGYETTCEVEYLTEAEYQANPPSERFNGAKTAPCAAPIPAGFGDEPASSRLSGLTIGRLPLPLRRPQPGDSERRNDGGTDNILHVRDRIVLDRNARPRRQPLQPGGRPPL